jgi:O-antigen/teichoic acid export membrane protein
VALTAISSSGSSANSAPGPAPRLIRNAVVNLIRMGAFAIVALLLPMVLVRHLLPGAYNAWVLILQLGAYVNFLDLGLQTALSKYVAEYDASSDRDAAANGTARVASSAVLLLVIGAAIGTLLTIAMAVAVPYVFPQMPDTLVIEVRWALIFYGVSMALALPASAFAGIFLGLQRNAVPMLLQSSNKVVTGAVTIAAVLLHSRIRYMAMAVAAVNLIFALAQIGFWRWLASHIRISFRLADRATVMQLLRYCSVLTLWSVAMLFVSGFDTLIVGHYDFHSTAFYSVSANATTFLAALLSAVMSPLIPATSALSVNRSAQDMGRLLLRATRYNAALLLAAGLPLLLFSFLILHIWMGATFATHGVAILRILLLATMLRMLGLPYAVMVIGTGRQWLASVSPVAEAIVNFTASLILVRHLGAVGVAWGTVIGAIVGLALHLSLSMRLTQDRLAISRTYYIAAGILLPLTAAIPAILAAPRWWSVPGLPMLSPLTWISLALSTLLLLWFCALDSAARRRLLH